MFSSYVDFLDTETWKYGKVDQSISGENGTRGKDVGSGIGGPPPPHSRVFQSVWELIAQHQPQHFDLTSRQEYVSHIGNATSISSMP